MEEYRACLREGVAIALQRLGDADMDGLLAAMRGWASGPPLVQRAQALGDCWSVAVAALPAEGKAHMETWRKRLEA